MEKKVLILGGTGAMGRPLQQFLLDRGYHVSVTSRREHSSENVTYLLGNAHDPEFLKKILSENHYLSIVDFMTYGTEEFKAIAGIMLDSTEQYIFMSSARVYAESDQPITEESPRILDVCTDPEYLKTDEYALKKAREENVLTASGKKNWTIIRPSITYNDERLQMPVAEKEDWLFRVLNGRSVIFPKDLTDIKTTMSYGPDVARAISLLVENEAAYGQIVNIAGAKAVTWGEVLDIYQKALQPLVGNVNVVYVDHVTELSIPLKKFYQVKYARAISREFNNEKLASIVGNVEFVSAGTGLPQCVSGFVENRLPFKTISWRNEALLDRLANERTPLKAFNRVKWKILYLIGRYIKIL